MDAFATAISFNLQYGVPLKFLVDKFAHVRSSPAAGRHQQIRMRSPSRITSSVLGAKFLGPSPQEAKSARVPSFTPPSRTRSRTCPLRP